MASTSNRITDLRTRSAIDTILDGDADNADWVIEFTDGWVVYDTSGGELELVGEGVTLREALLAAWMHEGGWDR